ncbi:MAG TPA: hypothetical protein VNR89_04160 [Roseomonas sp.]|nr:hypothetical protein [Roseomonas sp.]
MSRKKFKGAMDLFRALTDVGGDIKARPLGVPQARREALRVSAKLALWVDRLAEAKRFNFPSHVRERAQREVDALRYRLRTLSA